MGFAQGLSGLSASASNLDIIGNNIANAGTIGFKSGSVQFSDVYAGSQVGLGTKAAAVSQNFSAGAVQTSSRAMDVAIVEGDGFFRLTNPAGEIAYSRNGQFNMDKNGYIVNAAGMQLTGHSVNATGTVDAGLVALKLPSTAMVPKATEQVAAQFNLDSRSPIPSAPFDPTDSSTYNYSNSLTVYDSLGDSHELATFFVKTDAVAPSTSSPWVMYATADGVPVKGTPSATATAVAAANAASTLAIAASVQADATAAASAAVVAAAVPAATAEQITQAGLDAKAATAAKALVATTAARLAAAGDQIGQLAFDASGNLLSPADGKMALEGITFPNGSSPMTITADVTSTTQFGDASDVKQLTQDGFASGTLVGFSIGQDGTITGKYSNEQVKAVGQVVLSSFVNPAGLLSKGDNVWTETSASGSALTGQPGAGTRLGALASGALESSNVDLTSELVNLIIAQRTYQANAQTVKTQDQVVQTLMNMR